MKFVQSLVNVGAPQSESGTPQYGGYGVPRSGARQSLAPQFHEIINKAIDKTEFVDSSSQGAGAEFSIEHGLGTIPIGYIVISQDSAGSVYKSDGTPWDTSRIYLKASAAMAIRVLIF